MSFCEDLEQIEHLQGSCRPGLKGLKAADRPRFSYRSSLRLTGSADMDTALCQAYPNAARWDYVIAHRNGSIEEVTFVEVHPASSDSSIDEVSAKRDWLIMWISGKPISRYQRRIVWVASGRSCFTSRDPRVKSLANRGVEFVGRHCRLETA